MRPVAERLVTAVPTAAKRDRLFAPCVYRFPLCVDHMNVTGDEIRTVWGDLDFDGVFNTHRLLLLDAGLPQKKKTV